MTLNCLIALIYLMPQVTPQVGILNPSYSPENRTKLQDKVFEKLNSAVIPNIRAELKDNVVLKLKGGVETPNRPKSSLTPLLKWKR